MTPQAPDRLRETAIRLADKAAMNGDWHDAEEFLKVAEDLKVTPSPALDDGAILRERTDQELDTRVDQSGVSAVRATAAENPMTPTMTKEASEKLRYQCACGTSWSYGPDVPKYCPTCGLTNPDLVCEHGMAMDVHCCNCHSGFIFDMNHECADDSTEQPSPALPRSTPPEAKEDKAMSADTGKGHESSWLHEARAIAAQCWTDETTSDREMDVVLAESVARRIAAWMDTAAMFAKNEDFYRGLLDKCGVYLGPEVYVSDDGSVQDSPLRLKVPELVASLVTRVRRLESESSSPVDAAPIRALVEKWRKEGARSTTQFPTGKEWDATFQNYEVGQLLKDMINRHADDLAALLPRARGERA